MTFTLRVPQRRGAPNAPGARFLSPAAPERGELATNTEARDQRTVPLDIICPDVVKETTTVADHLHESPTGVMIALVEPKVFGEVIDPFRQDRDLNFG